MLFLLLLFTLAVVSLCMAVRVVRYHAAIREYEIMLANHIELQCDSLETRFTELKLGLRRL